MMRRGSGPPSNSTGKPNDYYKQRSGAVWWKRPYFGGASWVLVKPADGALPTSLPSFDDIDNGECFQAFVKGKVLYRARDAVGNLLIGSVPLRAAFPTRPKPPYVAPPVPEEAPPVASSLLTDLISYWTLDEASGTRFDSHGSNDLTDNNTVTSAAGKLGDAAQFTVANGEYLSVADNASLDLTTAMTLAGWVYADSLISAYIASKWDYGTNGAWGFKMQSGPLQAYITDSLGDVGSNVGEGSTSLSVSTWYHVALVYDGTQTGNANRLKLYVNGAAETVSFSGAIAASLQNSSADLRLGRLGAVDQNWDGRMDEFGLWGRALSEDEVDELYGSGTPPAYPFS